MIRSRFFCNLVKIKSRKYDTVGRKASTSTSTGKLADHNYELRKFVTQAL